MKVCGAERREKLDPRRVGLSIRLRPPGQGKRGRDQLLLTLKIQGQQEPEFERSINYACDKKHNRLSPVISKGHLHLRALNADFKDTSPP